MKTITAFKCEYCSKKLEKKSAMEHHEKWCVKNPKNDTLCFDCKNLIEVIVAHIPISDYEYCANRDVKGYKCIK